MSDDFIDEMTQAYFREMGWEPQKNPDTGNDSGFIEVEMLEILYNTETILDSERNTHENTN